MRTDKAILISYLCYIALGFYDGMLGVVWPAISTDLGVPLESLGVLLLTALLGFVLVSFNNGPLTRALSLRTFLLAGLLLRAAGFALLALWPSWPVAIASIFLMALGGGGLDSGLNLFVSQRGSARQLNWLHAAFGIGATAGPFLAAVVLVAGLRWTWNFGLVAGLLGIIAILVWRTARLWQLEPPPAAESKKPGGVRLADSLRLPIVWVSTALFFVYVGTELTAGQWSFSLLSLGRGMPDLSAKFWVGIYWGTFTLGRILFGLVADRVRIDGFLRGALLATVIGAGLLWWNPVAGLAVGGLLLMGLAEAPIYPSLIAATGARVGRAHAANAIGFQVAAAGVGGTLITSLVGLLAARIDFEAIGAAAFVLAAATWLTYEGLLRMSRKTQPATRGS